MAITVLVERPGIIIGRAGSLLICLGLRTPTEEDIEVLGRYVKAASDEGHFTLLIPLLNLQTPGTVPVLQAGRKMLEQYSAKMRLCLFSVEARGVPGILARTALAGLSLLVSIPFKASNSLPEAMRLIRELPGQDPVLRGDVYLEGELISFADRYRAAAASAAAP